jgi:hypothetical protein
MSEQIVVDGPDEEEFVGYGPAAAYLGMNQGALAYYVRSGYGPEPKERRQDRAYVRYVFSRGELDRWRANRPGRGFRSDRVHAGFGKVCTPCEGTCSVRMPD